MKEQLDAQKCIELLKKAFEENGRFPKRSDFSGDEVMMIKAHFGPWPRALEKAGIKPERDDGFAQRKIEKRKNAKIKKRNFKKSEKG